MTFEVREAPWSALDELARVPIAFLVERVLDVEASAQGLALVERPVASPWVKDYDAIAGEGPGSWAERFDLSRWGLLLARTDGVRVGGVTIAFDTPAVAMLEGRRDLAVIWDLRVAPEHRRRGAGAALFAAAEAWAAARGARRLKVETQNVNVPACRFYSRQGCALGAIHRFAYPLLPDESQLLWYKELAPLGVQP